MGGGGEDVEDFTEGGEVLGLDLLGAASEVCETGGPGGGGGLDGRTGGCDVVKELTDQGVDGVGGSGEEREEMVLGLLDGFAVCGESTFEDLFPLSEFVDRILYRNHRH